MFFFETQECVIYKDHTIFIGKINVSKEKEKKNPILWTRKEDKLWENRTPGWRFFGIALVPDVLFDF